MADVSGFSGFSGFSEMSGMTEQGGGPLSREQLDAYFASYVGMEGGSPASAVWFCDSMPTSDSTRLPAELVPVREVPAWDAQFRLRHLHEMSKWQTHQRIARIMAAAREMVLFGRDDSGDWQRYLAQYLYRPRGWDFKLSLFPLAIRSENGLPWTQLHGNQPELNPKSRYLALCRNGARFRFIAQLRRRERPKVVVCLGERFEVDYVQAFGMRGVPFTTHTLQPADQARELRVYVSEGTNLIICPAVAGAAGLASDVLLNAMGRFISQWLTMADFQVRPHETELCEAEYY
ncbi:transcriptional regulator [Cupriavidus sp. YAF13]